MDSDLKAVLIVDDEANIRKIISVQLSRHGFETVTASDGLKALDILNKRTDISAVISDLKMPGMDGVNLLRNIKKINSRLPVVILTAFGSITGAVEAVKAGAFDYMEKPFDKENLLQMVTKAVTAYEESQKDASPVELNSATDENYGMIGESASLKKVVNLIRKVSSSNSTVLITGESGTGKELVASAIHASGERSNQTFMKVNCAAIPENFMESEFFGYEKGAFTGAQTAKPGRFELADGGTLLLDEVGEIPFAMQAKLLRVLQENEFERVGGIKTRKVDVRVLASTNRNLTDEIAAGNFREDLYYRLNVLPVNVPPLRDRSEDIPVLVNYFMEKFRTGPEAIEVSSDAMKKLKLYPWPGNIRELENVIERTLLLSDGHVIEKEDLPPEIAGLDSRAVLPGAVSEKMENFSDSGLKEVVRRETSRVEKELISRALESTQWNVTRAANILRISRKGLQLKMKELGLRENEK
ncbi:MAG: sigma-54-dependent Fis family transcriptional regulator [Deltaproteobacteria bacterium]|nr:sigma-54-dependent Fis family transcriptional regulator [Deltaproteobacteria bacterium]